MRWSLSLPPSLPPRSLSLSLSHLHSLSLSLSLSLRARVLSLSLSLVALNLDNVGQVRTSCRLDVGAHCASGRVDFMGGEGAVGRSRYGHALGGER